MVWVSGCFYHLGSVEGTIGIQLIVIMFFDMDPRVSGLVDGASPVGNVVSGGCLLPAPHLMPSQLR
jgi:hypothetical protein